MINFRQTRFWQNYLQYQPIFGNSSMRGFVDAILFWKILSEFPRQTILEIGCYQGLTTGLFFDRIPTVQVTTVDIVDRFDIFRSHHHDHLGQHRFILDDSKDISLHQDYDFILVDGDHGFETCWQDIQLSLQHITSDGILALDDYRMPGVAKAIENLYNLDNNWVPFMQGIQTQFWHHRDQNKNNFLDNLLLDPINNFILLGNIIDPKGNTILEANCVRMLTDHYKIFDQALEMYNI